MDTLMTLITLSKDYNFILCELVMRGDNVALLTTIGKGAREISSSICSLHGIIPIGYAFMVTLIEGSKTFCLDVLLPL